MKKLITLLLAAGAFVTLHAQTSRDEARRVILGQPKNTNGTYGGNSRDVILGPGGNSQSYPYGSREAQIDQVNREYDQKIYSIRNNPNLSQAEKDRIIRQLERERQQRINQINNSYSGNNNNDDYYKKNKKYKGNNGKHLGWEKGKGNPHRNGGKPGKGRGDRDDD